MADNKRNKSMQWIIPFVLLFNSWSFLGGWVSLFARTWIWLIIGMVSLVTIETRFFSTKAFFALVVYALIVIANFLFGDEYYRSIEYVILDITQFVFYAGFGYHILHNKLDNNISNTILYLELFVIIFTSIATYFADQQIPNICRMTVGYTSSGESCDPFYRMGVCKYDMPHALPILIPPLILWMKQKQARSIFKLFTLIVIFFIFLLIWISAATTPLLLAIIALSVSIVIKPTFYPRSNFTRILIVLMLASPLAIPTVQLNLIHTLDRILPDTNNNKTKLQGFEDRIVYGSDAGGDLKGREDLYQMSLNAFINNPIVGTDKIADIGEHCIFLDRLAVLGIVGFVPFLLFFWFFFSDAYYCISQPFRLFYLMGVMCLILMYASKNMPENWLHLAAFVLLPIMINYVPKDKKDK